MIKAIFMFEIRKHLSKISIYIYFLIFFSLAFLSILAAGGALKGVVMGFGTSRKAMVNSPLILFNIIAFISYFGILNIAALMAQSIYQDFRNRTYHFFFTFPITSAQYLTGRFLSAFAVLVFIFSSVGLGAWIGTMTPFVDKSFFGPQIAMAYIQPYFLIVLPNIFFIGAIFFCLSTLTRKIFPVYAGSVILLIGYLIALPFSGDIDNKIISALIDPFGIFAADQLTEYWTVAEQNLRLVPLEGILLLNRAAWVGLGVFCLVLTYLKFSFTEATTGRKTIVEAEPALELVTTVTADTKKPSVPPPDQSLSGKWKIVAHLTRLEFRETIKNIYFIVIVLCGVLFMFSQSANLGKLYGTQTYPVTYKTLDLIGGSFALFVLIVITFYAGELIWRERDNRMNQLFDALPLKNWQFFLSKFATLLGIQLLLWGIVMICCIMIQVFKGYYNFEVSLYLKDLFGLKFIDFALISLLALFIQVIVNNKYVGHFVMVVYYILSINLAIFGYDHNLYNYGSSPGTPYSDMNGFGHYIIPFIWFKIYWIVFAIILALLSNLFWTRGVEQGIRWRTNLALSRLNRSYKLALSFSAFIFLVVGVFIFYNTNILNAYERGKDREEKSVRYEKTYKKYEHLPQPRITDVKVNVDIYPSQRDVSIKGYQMLQNKSDTPVERIILDIFYKLDIRELIFDRPAKLELEDKELGFYIYVLESPMQPGEQMKLDFTLDYITHGFMNSGSSHNLVYNGTFFNSSILPSIGYNESGELSDERTRKKYGLDPKPRMASINDHNALMNNYISSDSDWVTFEAIVSTEPDQIAIAPGYLQKEWVQDNRRYFHYKMDSKILNFFSFISARYEVRKDRWKDVAIEIYYHPGHDYNVDQMIEAIKKSMDYYTVNFSPYQHKQVRIIEFPRYESFAQSFPNTIPYSESIGFIARVDEDDPDAINYPFFVTAHELAHQWWAHQLIGANVQGCTVMSEALAQYSSMMVMEKEFGHGKMRKFLKHELDSYLRGRSMEPQKELPLALNENQQYIHYNKGCLVMYALKDYIGEEAVNRALAAYLGDKSFQEPPYTTSMEFLEYIRAETPDDMQYLIEDLFETITLYDNRALTATSTKKEDGSYDITLSVKAAKIRADEMGNEEDRPLHDLIDIGIFDEMDNLLYLEKHLVDQKDMQITISVDKKPAKAGIDPLNKLIDRKPDDNRIAVTFT